MREIVIAGYARSPFQPAHKGALARMRPDELAAQVVAALIERTRVDPNAIEDVIVGCAFPEGEQGLNVRRRSHSPDVAPLYSEFCPPLTDSGPAGSLWDSRHPVAAGRGC